MAQGKSRQGKSQPQRQATPQSEPLRLNKFIAASGACSRRDADEFIQAGHVKVNGAVVRELGTKVLPSDQVTLKGKALKPEQNRYILLNKPKDFITTMEDTHDRKTVMQLVNKACKERIYPVGRLDRHTTGLLLFTNDGELAKRLTHPSHKVKKIYQVELDRPISPKDFDKILEGLTLDDGPVTVDELAIIGSGQTTLGIEIHIGRNRIVRRIFEHLGYKVKKLDRVMFGPLTKRDLARGKWRHLSPKEVNSLKSVVGKVPKKQ